MFLMNEEEFNALNEGFIAYCWGSTFGIYKNKIEELNGEKIKSKTEKIDEQMERKGFKPCNNPNNDEMKELIWGKFGKNLVKKKGEEANKFNMINLYSLDATKWGFYTFNDRKYMYIKSSSIFDFKNDKGNVGAIYPIYKNKKGKLTMGIIWITNPMINKK